MADKKALRAEMRARRSACADREIRDEALFRRITGSALYRESESVLCYVSFGDEAGTLRLLRQALADGKRVFVPRCVPNTNQMVFYRIETLDALKPGSYGILEPPDAEYLRYTGADTAICFVPGLAFTAQGMRIGYGKGYFDTFLEKIDVCAVGLCYDFQLVPDIPAQAHDISMDYIITDKSLYRCGAEKTDCAPVCLKKGRI